VKKKIILFNDVFSTVEVRRHPEREDGDREWGTGKFFLKEVVVAYWKILLGTGRRHSSV
jgi:hypothetical protein